MSDESNDVTKAERRASLLKRYQQNADLPLLVLSLAVLPLIAVEYLDNLRPRAEEGLEITYALIWVAFLADYIIGLVLSPKKTRNYVRDEWFDLLIVILTVPLAINPLEIFRAARSLRLLRVFRFGAVAARGAQRAVKFPGSANSQLAVAGASFVTVTLVSAVLVLAVEEGTRGSQINSMGQALWWAVATVTTVGFGDVVPRTTAGRFFALVPMIAGVTLVAFVASNLVQRLYAKLEQRVKGDLTLVEDPIEPALGRRLDAMTAQIDHLERLILSTQMAGRNKPAA